MRITTRKRLHNRIPKIQIHQHERNARQNSPKRIRRRKRNLNSSFQRRNQTNQTSIRKT